MMRNLYSVSTFDSFQNLQLETSILLKTYLVQYLLCDDVHSHPLEPDGKQRKLSMLKMSLLKACNGFSALFEEDYALPGFFLNFSKKEKTAQPKCMFTGVGLRWMSEGRDRYAIDWPLGLSHLLFTEASDLRRVMT